MITYTNEVKRFYEITTRNRNLNWKVEGPLRRDFS